MSAPPTRERFGLVRVVVYGVLAISYMSVFFHRIAPAVIAGELMAALATSGAELGTLAATYYYVYTVMQLPAGVLADTLGVRVVAGAGALVAGVGSVIFGLAPSLAVAAVGRILVGLGVSVVFVGMMRANTVWWSERHYGAIGGLTILLGNVGAILAAGPLATLLQVVSWRAVFVVAGALSLLIAAATFAFVRNRPEDAGFPSLRELEGQAPHAALALSWRRDLRDVLRTPAIWPTTFVTFGMCGSLLALIGLWAVPLLRDVHGLTRVQASLYTTVSLAGLAVGSLLQGTLSDRIARRKAVLVGASMSSLAVWLAFAFLPWGPGPSGLLVFALFGLCCGGFVVAFGAAKEVVAPALAGMAIAVVNAGLFLGAAIAQTLFGWLLDRTWDGTVIDGVRRYRAADYAGGLWLCVGLALFSALVSLRVRETRCRNLTVAAALALVFLLGGPARAEDPPAEEARPWIEGQVEPGDSLIAILARHGLDADEPHAVIRAIGDRMDMRALRPGQVVRLRLDDAGRVAELELRLSRRSTVRVSRGADGALVARREDGEIRVERVAIAGTIDSTLHAAIRDTGESTALVGFFVDVFAYDLDFYVDTHQGDSFRMIVEKEYVGGELLRYGTVLAAEYSGRAGTFRAFHWRPPGEAEGRYFDEQGRAIERTFLKSPLKYSRVSSRFNPRRMHPILHVRRGHFGVDYAAPTGTPIWAAASGKIVFRGRRGGAGNCVILAHDNGYQTTYMHMSRFRRGQKIGRRVRAKDVIGYVGQTGLASGPHLHFSVKIGRRHVDPLRLKMTRGAGLAARDRPAFARHIALEIARLATLPLRKPDAATR